MALSLCPSCSRHVRASEALCPFCGAAFTASSTQGTSRGRLSRAAMVFGAVAIGASAAACSKETIAQPYGAPPIPPQEDAGSAVVALYGAPPELPPTPSAAPTIVQPYGAPPDIPGPDAAAPKPSTAPKK